ncbi:hypothetical protein DFH09DRAFT_1372760, partial [Mycena vulgaris]
MQQAPPLLSLPLVGPSLLSPRGSEAPPFDGPWSLAQYPRRPYPRPRLHPLSPPSFAEVGARVSTLIPPPLSPLPLPPFPPSSSASSNSSTTCGDPSPASAQTTIQNPSPLNTATAHQPPFTPGVSALSQLRSLYNNPSVKPALPVDTPRP